MFKRLEDLILSIYVKAKIMLEKICNKEKLAEEGQIMLNFLKKVKKIVDPILKIGAFVYPPLRMAVMVESAIDAAIDGVEELKKDPEFNAADSTTKTMKAVETLLQNPSVMQVAQKAVGAVDKTKITDYLFNAVKTQYDARKK